ncbi:MAG: PQQ-binding-like beta-propeller repeat protein [Anaerolineaceae bacterium]
MKISRFYLVLSILLLGILLTSCTGATTTNSWGGVTADDTTVYLSTGTSISVLHADSGTVIWSYPEKPAAGRLFYAAPVAVGDQLIVGDYTGGLVSLGIRDGKELWKFAAAKGHYVDAPLVVNDMIIAPNADSNIYAIDLTGKSIWTYKGSHAFWATPASDGTTVYAPSLDHYLYAINLADGQLKWKADLGGPLVGSPFLAQDGSLYIGTLDSTMFSINSADGTTNWKQTVAGGVWSAPVLLADRLYFGDASGKINLLQASDGKIVQTIDMQSAILGSGVAMNDNVAFGNEKADVIIIGKNGERVVTPSVTGKLYSNLVFSNGHLYVLSTAGDKALYTFDTAGTQIWTYSVSK